METGEKGWRWNLISYAGKTLEPFTKYYWQVIVWDKEGKKSKPSSIASFEPG
jgi:alpha-L-rhamnosidase